MRLRLLIIFAICLAHAREGMTDPEGIELDVHYLEPLTPRYHHIESPLIRELEASILLETLSSSMPDRPRYFMEGYFTIDVGRPLNRLHDFSFLNWLFLSLTKSNADGKQAKNGNGKKKDSASDSSSSDSESEDDPDEAGSHAENNGRKNDKDGADGNKEQPPPQTPEVREITEKSSQGWMVLSINGKEFRVKRKAYEQNSCCICLALVNNAVPTCPGHNACAECRDGMERTRLENLCPTCRSGFISLTEDNVQIVRLTRQAAINTMEVACCDCQWEGEYSDIPTHSASCVRVCCRHAGCTEEFSQSDEDAIHSHEAECPWQPQTVTVSLPQWLSQALSECCITNGGNDDMSIMLQGISVAITSHQHSHIEAVAVAQNSECQTEVFTSEVECQVEAETTDIECQTDENEITHRHYQECEYFPVKCPCCDEKHPREQMHNHLTVCPKLIINCEHCDEEIEKAAMPDHLKHTCPQSVVQCRHCAYQCVRAKMPAHEFECLTTPRNCHQCRETYRPEDEFAHFEQCRPVSHCIQCGEKNHPEKCIDRYKPNYAEVGNLHHMGCGLYRCQNNLSRFFWVIPKRLFYQLCRRNLHCVAAGTSHQYRGYTYQLLLRAKDSELHIRLIVTGRKYGVPGQCTVFVMAKEYQHLSSQEVDFTENEGRFELNCNLGKFGRKVNGIFGGDERCENHLILMFDITGIK